MPTTTVTITVEKDVLETTDLLASRLGRSRSNYTNWALKELNRQLCKDLSSEAEGKIITEGLTIKGE